jgi:membrane protease YdiL (CAAX protease family)
MNENPVMIVLYLGVAGYVLNLYRADYRSNASLAAGIVEEVIFRGYLVVSNRGRTWLVGSCLGFSLLFALIHGHLWSTEDGFAFTCTTKAVFTTSILFVNSLWFYALRFGRWNPNRSIFPCMIAHATSNLGVFVVKLAQGYVVF